MCRLVIHVHERALDVRKDFDLVLQLLADVVRFPERSPRVHHDVHLDKVVLHGASSANFRTLHIS